MVTPLCIFSLSWGTPIGVPRKRGEFEEGPWSLVLPFWPDLCIVSTRGEPLRLATLVGLGGTKPLRHGRGGGGVLPHHCPDPVQILHPAQVSFSSELLEPPFEGHREEAPGNTCQWRLDWIELRADDQTVPKVDIPSPQHCQSWELESRSCRTASEMIFLLKNRWKVWLFSTLPPKTCECKAPSSEWRGRRCQAGKAEDSRRGRPEWHLGNQGADQGEAVNTGCDSLSVAVSALMQETSFLVTCLVKGACSQNAHLYPASVNFI